jgi:hypothetical protein
MSHVVAQRIAGVLGNLGLLPFFALAVASWLPLGDTGARLVLLALVGYAAVILSFLGAVHWGLALLSPQLDKTALWNTLGWGVLPSLLGWLALLLALGGLAPWLVVLILMSDLLLCRLMDGALLRQFVAVHPGYLSLRTRLTVGALLALGIALFAHL